MDIKLKKWNIFINFTLFFLGVTLFIGNILPIMTRIQMIKSDIQTISEKDYQNTADFKWYISTHLENFITLATGGPINRNLLEWYGYYSEYAYPGSLSGKSENDIRINEKSSNNIVTTEESYKESAYNEYPYDEYGNYNESYFNSIPEEQREKVVQQINQVLQNDKNLLYIVTYENTILYSNTDSTTLDGPSKTLPDGYNFMLYYDGDKVHITKDGKDIDIYQNGFYKENMDSWYVPGYQNFTTDEKAKKVTICIAVIKEPTVYIRKSYSNQNNNVYNNNYLYDLTQRETYLQQFYLSHGILSLIGIILLSISMIFYKYKVYANKYLAKLSGKIWYEFKIVFIFLFGLFTYWIYSIFINNEWFQYARNEYQYFSFQEIVQPFFEIMGSHVAYFVILFWFLYFLINDIRYNKSSWKHSLINQIFSTLNTRQSNFSFEKKIIHQQQFIFGAELILSSLIFVLLASICFSRYQKNNIYICIFLILCLFFFLLYYRFFYIKHHISTLKDIDSLMEQIECIRNGNLTDKVFIPKETELTKVFENLNEIQQGMEIALNEKIKSEQMKVELVSNVSHDIKTPLTSIISYVDLLKQETDLPDYIKDYIQILDRKSQRLKSMVQDVFEVSKASSGQLSIEIEELDFGKLIRQTLADMQEQIVNSSVIIKTDLPTQPIFISADGQRLYRVFQNLIQNALQYSLDGSRVYISFTTTDTMASVSIKNTSKTELTNQINYTERFTRGDYSRTDGGSGLGLSIAQSFTEASGGNFSIEIIADLFVVTIEFPIIVKEGDTF